ncbi:glycine cleavage system aminomethyltransferase GcvT [Propionibacterium freudenreichii]|nr:glycine cleavage system aminomethyltransferase GcvT [Propionibacterium freudenreichii]MDK9298795.1 glycine cleavage system aminomethyltransferase GcvT [Propionibacterium freudenreichii]
MGQKTDVAKEHTMADSTDSLQRSPLNECHEKLGAKFSEFSGWLMPLEYEGHGVLAEHKAVRDAVGIFDVSHLGKIRVTGPGAKDYLNGVLAADLNKIVPGKAQYQLLCTPEGGVVDDMIAYLLGDGDVFLIPNAANNTTVAQILAEGAPEGVNVVNQHHDFAIMAVQGHKSPDVLATMGLPTDMDYMAFEVVPVGDSTFTVCRTGYTGETGFELVVPSDHAVAVWEKVLEAGKPFGIVPCGLAARDTLRTEMGYSLHGHEISPEIDPVSAGLTWAIGWDKPDFRGAEALRAIRANKPARRNRGLRAVGRGIPRPGMSVVPAGAGPDAEPIGVLTSGTFSPTLRIGIGLALIDTSIKPGDKVGVVVRNRVEEFDVVKPPFVQPHVR